MTTLSDDIERYIRHLLKRTDGQPLEVQRVALANRFRCVPSQINYVLQTRFTIERGYVVESRRGEGGYIRIIKVESPSRRHLLMRIHRTVADGVSLGNVRDYVNRLREESIISEREARLMLIALRGDHGSVSGWVLSERERGEMLQRFIEMILSVSSKR